MPDARGLDKGFHDVTIVDMDDEREPTVTPADMTRLRELWPPEIFNHMRWFQQDLELMRKSAKMGILTVATDAMQIMWESDSGRHVPACGQTMEMSNSLVLLKIVWSMYEMATMFRGYPRPPVLRSMPHHKLYVVSYGQIPCGWNIRAFRLIYCCSASWDCR